MKPIAATTKSPAKAAVALAVSLTLAASMALAAPATAQAKNVKKPAKVAKPSVSKVKATSFKVTWKKAKRAKGYQVKVMKGAKTVKTIKVKKKYCYATGLSAKTTYKVKVRAYNQSGKKVKYGKWSKARSVTTKKSSSSYAGWEGFTWNSKTNTWEYQRPQTHTHEYKSGTVTTTSMRIYYCLKCGAKYTSKTKLHDHADSTGHLQKAQGSGNLLSGYWEGYIYEDGKQVKYAESAQLKSSSYAYSYVTFNGVTKDVADSYKITDRCSCGAEKAHAHNWKSVSAKKTSFYWSRYKTSCGWTGTWGIDGISPIDELDEHIDSSKEHWKDSYSVKSQSGDIYSSLDYYACSDCGMKAIVLDD